MKKKQGLLACGLMSLCLMTTTISAASGLNKAEESLLNYLNDYSTLQNKEEFTLTVDLINKVENYLIRDGVELTEAQVNDVIKIADEGIQALIDKNALSGKDLTPEEGKEFVNKYIVPICNILNLSVVYDAKNSNVIIKDVNGDIVYADDDPIKDTGTNASSSFAILGCLTFLAIGFCAFELKKKYNN